MKIKKLNGWQRLWVVCSAAWLVFVVIWFLAEGVIPNTGTLESDLGFQTRKLQREWALATIEAARPASGATEQLTAQQIRSAAIYRYLSDAAVVERVHKNFPEVDYGNVDLVYEIGLDALQFKHQEKLDGLLVAQAKGVGAILLLWLIPSFGLYLLGLAVVWVWRGFKLKGESQ